MFLPIINQFDLQQDRVEVNYIVEAESNAESLTLHRTIHDFLKEDKNVLLIAKSKYRINNLKNYLSKKKKFTGNLLIVNNEDFLTIEDEIYSMSYGCIIIIMEDLSCPTDDSSIVKNFRLPYNQLKNKIEQKVQKYDCLFTFVSKMKKDILPRDRMENDILVKDWLKNISNQVGYLEFTKNQATYSFSIERSYNRVYYLCIKDRYANRRDLMYESCSIVPIKDGMIFKDEYGLDEIIDFLEEE